MTRYAQGRHLGSGAAPLDEIFVPTPILAPLPEPRPEAGEALPTSQLPYLWPELAAQVATEPASTLTLYQVIASARRVALLAPPGGGRSTTLAYLALTHARKPKSPGGQPRPGLLPIYAHLAELELESDEEAKEPAAERPLLKAVQRRAGTPTADPLPGVLNRALESGRSLVLSDRWDELAPAERPAYTRWLSQLLAAFPDNQFIISAPLDRYGPPLDLGFAPLCLKSWQAAEATELAQRWAAALKTTLPTVREGRDQEHPRFHRWASGVPA